MPATRSQIGMCTISRLENKKFTSIQVHYFKIKIWINGVHTSESRGSLCGFLWLNVLEAPLHLCPCGSQETHSPERVIHQIYIEKVIKSHSSRHFQMFRVLFYRNQPGVNDLPWQSWRAQVERRWHWIFFILYSRLCSRTYLIQKFERWFEGNLTIVILTGRVHMSIAPWNGNLSKRVAYQINPTTETTTTSLYISLREIPS